MGMRPVCALEIAGPTDAGGEKKGLRHHDPRVTKVMKLRRLSRPIAPIPSGHETCLKAFFRLLKDTLGSPAS